MANICEVWIEVKAYPSQFAFAVCIYIYIYLEIHISHIIKLQLLIILLFDSCEPQHVVGDGYAICNAVKM